MLCVSLFFFFFSSRRRHTRFDCDWSSDVCSSDLNPEAPWPALVSLREKTAQAGFELRARLAVYPEFILQGEKFIRASLIPYIERVCDEDGFVKRDLSPLSVISPLAKAQKRV